MATKKKKRSSKNVQLTDAKRIRTLEREISQLRKYVDRINVSGLLGLLKHVTYTTGTLNGLRGPHLRFCGVNVHICNGTGTTEGKVNGKGNLVIGYNELQSGPPGGRNGSHNLISGTKHKYKSFGGVIMGTENEINKPYNFSSGRWNQTLGYSSMIFGGIVGAARGDYSCVTGGASGKAFGDFSTVTGGYFNLASGSNASTIGGHDNTAQGGSSIVAGGSYGLARSGADAVLGGTNMRAGGGGSVCVGGYDSAASGVNSTMVGGCGFNIAQGEASVVVGGTQNRAAAECSVVMGGFQNIAEGELSSVCGGERNKTKGERSVVLGGVTNQTNTLHETIPEIT